MVVISGKLPLIIEVMFSVLLISYFKLVSCISAHTLDHKVINCEILSCRQSGDLLISI